MAKTKFKLVRMDPDENEQLEQTAARLGLSASEFLRRSWRVSAPQFKKMSAVGVRQKEPQGSRVEGRVEGRVLR